MKIFMKWVLVCSLCFIVTSCSKLDEIDINDTLAISNNTTDSTVSTIEENSAVTTINSTECVNVAKVTETKDATIVSKNDMQKWGRTYARTLMEKLARTTDIYGFTPISNEIDADAGMNGILSIVYLMDVDMDGIPEMLAGTASVLDGYELDVYSYDSAYWGNIKCTWDIYDNVVVIDDVMYSICVGNKWDSIVKFEVGVPSVITYMQSNDTLNITIKQNENVEKYNNVIKEQHKDIVNSVLGIDYDVLHNLWLEKSANNTNSCFCVQGYLQVPDPKNYNEEDIYNCILELLTKYEKLAATQ